MQTGQSQPTVVAPYARRTARLADLVRAVALALGGEGGARLLAALGLHASPDALLDAIRAATRPAIPAPRAIGIDDWSWRRGHRFGTIIVDLERHAVVDLLPDRAVASTAAWLREHPQVAVIARDRGGVYAEAAATGAPRAMQVADRWHLMHNLAEVLEELLLHKRAALRDAASAALPSEADPDGADPPAAMVATGATAGTAEHTPGPLTPGRPRRGQECLAEARRLRQERLVGQYQAIRRLHAAGADVADIARRVGTSRRTVYRYRNLPRQILFHHAILCRRASPRPRPATPNTRPTRRSIAVGHVRQPSCRTRRSPDWLGGEARCDGAVAPQGGERNRAYGPTRAGMAC